MPAIGETVGRVIFITSQPQELADHAKLLWQCESLEFLGDPSNALSAHFNAAYDSGIAVTDKGGYAQGMQQPAVLVFKRGPDDTPHITAPTLIFMWATEPGLMNLGGASDRPDPGAIWEAIRLIKDSDSIPSVAVTRASLNEPELCELCKCSLQ